MKEKPRFTITYGGWYQRTTIHLSEIYDLLAFGKSSLPLSPKKLQKLQNKLKLKKVSREAGYLEYVKAQTNEGIEIRYYEDGLYILEIKSSDIRQAGHQLKKYYDEVLNPAIKYIFSLGAPTPKIMANIQTVHPLVIGFVERDHSNFIVDKRKFGEVYSKIVSKDVTVYKTPEFIFVVSDKIKLDLIDELNEMQIFFREFKDHLEKYLDIHRQIWEAISKIKKKKHIKGSNIAEIRYKLDQYNKTVTLISYRINQMGAYVNTRASIAKTLDIETYLCDLFSYKFEILTNTLVYIKEIWAMTREYLNSAIQRIVEIQDKSTNSSLKSLGLITTFGVIASSLNYISSNRVPEPNLRSILYFGTLLLAAWLIDKIIIFVYQRIKYKLSFSDDMTKFK